MGPFHKESCLKNHQFSGAGQLLVFENVSFDKTFGTKGWHRLKVLASLGEMNFAWAALLTAAMANVFAAIKAGLFWRKRWG